MIQLTSFYPDLDEHQQGVITNLEMMIPTMRGYRGAPSLTSIAPALAAQCRGAAAIIKLDGTSRVFAGTQTKLYELSSGTWNDISRDNPPSSANDYTGSSDSVWRFAQFGDVSLAVNGVDAFQFSSSTGDFEDLAGAPKAATIDTVGGFVMVGNYNDGTDTPDGIHWSALYDYTDWTPDVATQCGNIRLLDTPGEVVALRRLGQNAVAYKRNSMYLMVNNGPPVLWGSQLISGEVGALSHEAVVATDTFHFFISDNDIYVFDGARPQSIGDGVREWFFADLHRDYAYKTKGVYDKANSIVYWYYASIASTGELDSCIVYHPKTGRWGRANRTIEACLEYITPAYTYGDLQTDYSTYDAIPAAQYGSPFWGAADINMGVFGSDHILYTLTGSSTSSSLTTGAVGDDVYVTLIQRVQPRFTDDPTSGSMVNLYRMTDGSAYTIDQTSTLSSGRFDVLRSARWHKFKMSFTGDVEITGINYKTVTQGDD